VLDTALMAKVLAEVGKDKEDARNELDQEDRTREADRVLDLRVNLIVMTAQS
jgi:hypothetical protein